jgi:hypothetical protein
VAAFRDQAVTNGMRSRPGRSSGARDRDAYAARIAGRPISIADFAVKGRKVAIYVDGAALADGRRVNRRCHAGPGAESWEHPPQVGSAPATKPLNTAAAHPTPARTRIAPGSQFLAQAPHSMQAPRSASRARFFEADATGSELRRHGKAHLPENARQGGVCRRPGEVHQHEAGDRRAERRPRGEVQPGGEHARAGKAAGRQRADEGDAERGSLQRKGPPRKPGQQGRPEDLGREEAREGEGSVQGASILS